MKFKLLGSSGLRVSELCLGTMTLSSTNPWGWGTDKENSLKILKSYFDDGGMFIDTANNYQNGESEQIISEFVKGNRDDFVIATKFTLHNNSMKDNPNAGGNQRKNLLRSVKASLDRLQTDFIDLLYLHVWDYTTPISELMHSLNSLVEQGKIHYIAISDSPAWVVSQANMFAEMRGYEKFVAYQFPYNLSRRDPEREVIPYSKYNDLAMTPWNVLGGGLFTGKYTRLNNTHNSRLSDKHWGAPSENRLEIAKKVDEIADELGVSSAQTAVAWSMAQDKQIIPILGATKESQVQDFLGATEVKLSDDQLSRLSNVTEFELGFPQSFTAAENVQNIIHGNTYEKLVNHRFKGY